MTVITVQRTASDRCPVRLVDTRVSATATHQLFMLASTPLRMLADDVMSGVAVAHSGE